MKTNSLKRLLASEERLAGCIEGKEQEEQELMSEHHIERIEMIFKINFVLRLSLPQGRYTGNQAL